MVAPSSNDAPKRKLPSKAVLVRLLIYVPLLGFFGAQAGIRAVDEREAADEAFRADAKVWLTSPPGLVTIDAQAAFEAGPQPSAIEPAPGPTPAVAPTPAPAPTEPPAQPSPAQPGPAGVPEAPAGAQPLPPAELPAPP